MPDTSASSGRPVLRRLWRGLWFLVICYLGIIIMLMLLENWLVFHPTSASVHWLPAEPLKPQDVWLTTADGTRLHAWWCPGDGTDGAVLYCHGNAGNLSYRRGAILDWQRYFGESVLIVDYPGFGRSEGRPSEAGCYAAGEAAYDWLTAVKKVRPEKIILYGKSLGGGVAVDLACQRPHRALVLAKAFTSVPDLGQHLYPWLPARWLTRTQFNNVAKIGRCTRPVFITHGDCDELIPCSMGQQLYQAANHPKFFLPLPGVDHNEGLPPLVYARLKQFLAEAEAQTAAD